MSAVPKKRELREAIKMMDNNKAPGHYQLTTNMLKRLPEEGINFLTNLIRQYQINKECQIELWNIQQLVSLYKGKGDMQNLNNWRGICLKETTAKIASSIIARCLLKHFESLWPKATNLAKLDAKRYSMPKKKAYNSLLMGEQETSNTQPVCNKVTTWHHLFSYR